MYSLFGFVARGCRCKCHCGSQKVFFVFLTLSTPCLTLVVQVPVGSMVGSGTQKQQQFVVLVVTLHGQWFCRRRKQTQMDLSCTHRMFFVVTLSTPCVADCFFFKASRTTQWCGLWCLSAALHRTVFGIVENQ